MQLALDGAKLGLFLAMGAIGLSLIYGTTGLTNFAHSEMIVFGMMAAYFFNFYGLAGFMGFMASWPAPFGGGVNPSLLVCSPWCAAVALAGSSTSHSSVQCER